jgi:hypothetical protein
MGGVFINYRSVDDPMAAASIYQWLATKFGEHQVFRDCVTLDAGTHYPTGIRSALENAAVVIAVIGPRWLTLTDPETGVRLIDRKEDWVRQEIATAFRRDITVLPVLLKDTPENARHPTPAELPDDIRRLGTIQALAISQLRLGPDLARLAQTLTRLHPALVSVPPPQDIFYALVAALEAVPCLHHEDTRNLLVNRLRPAIAGNVRYSPQRRIHAMNIIRTCLDHVGGLTELIATIRAIEGEETVPLREFVAIAGQLAPESAP